MENVFQEVWDLYGEKYEEKGYLLTEIKELYWPIWKCQQEIIISTNSPLDGFSQVILQTIEAGCDKHIDICAFLGIGADSFVLGQFHYLLKQDWVRIHEGAYWLTPKGKDLLENNTNIQQLKTIDVEFYTIEQASSNTGSANLQFFDPKKPLNKALSKEKQKTFKGYRIYQNNRLVTNASVHIIRHRQHDAPSLTRLKEQRNNFAAFIQELKGKTLYDFGEGKSVCYPHSLCFLQLSYRKKEDKRSIRTDLRQCPKSVLDFNGFELEEKL